MYDLLEACVGVMHWSRVYILLHNIFDILNFLHVDYDSWLIILALPVVLKLNRRGSYNMDVYWHPKERLHANLTRHFVLVWVRSMIVPFIDADVSEYYSLYGQYYICLRNVIR